MSARGDDRPRSRLRGAAARILGFAGACLLLGAALADVVTAVPSEVLLALRPAAVAAGAGCWAIAFVLLPPAGRRRALVALFGLAAATGVAEVVLRVTVGPQHAAVYRAHDVWLHEHIPGAKRVNTRRADGALVPFHVNSDGFRGPELRPRGAGKRVVVYGDSFVAAEAVPWEDTFVARLGRELSEGRGADVEAVNAGVSGYGPDQVLLRMEAELTRLDPDLVVVTLLAENDYGDVVRNRIFDLDPGGALRRSRPVVAPGMLGELEEAPTAFVLTQLFRKGKERLHRALHGPTLLESDERAEIWLQTCRVEHRLAVEDGDREVRSVFRDYTDEDLRLDPGSESARHKDRLMSQVLAAIRDPARDRSVPLVFLVVPAAFDVCDDYDVDRADPARFPAYGRENLSAPFQRMADALGVPCLNLFVPFRGAGANSLYFSGGDTHWNAAGQALVARLLARFVEARGLMR